jgi:hypothetical protein
MCWPIQCGVPAHALRNRFKYNAQQPNNHIAGLLHNTHLGPPWKGQSRHGPVLWLMHCKIKSIEFGLQPFNDCQTKLPWTVIVLRNETVRVTPQAHKACIHRIACMCCLLYSTADPLPAASTYTASASPSSLPHHHAGSSRRRTLVVFPCKHAP